MSKRTTETIVKSSPEWGELEGWLRGSMAEADPGGTRRGGNRVLGQGEVSAPV